MLALDAVGEKPTVLHLNKVHAAFANLKRLRRQVPPTRPFPRVTTDMRPPKSPYTSPF
jgi:hypothetical protein